MSNNVLSIYNNLTQLSYLISLISSSDSLSYSLSEELWIEHWVLFSIYSSNSRSKSFLVLLGIFTIYLIISYEKYPEMIELIGGNSFGISKLKFSWISNNSWIATWIATSYDS